MRWNGVHQGLLAGQPKAAVRAAYVHLAPAHVRASYDADVPHIAGAFAARLSLLAGHHALGMLATERMVLLDEQTPAIVDRIVAARSPGRPLSFTPREIRRAPADTPRAAAGPLRAAWHTASRGQGGRRGRGHPAPAAPQLRDRAHQRWRQPASTDVAEAQVVSRAAGPPTNPPAP